MSDRKKVHESRNIKRFREMLNLKQDALAWELGEEWNQQKVSLLEQKEAIDEAILRQVSQILKIPVEAIKNFDEENAVNVIANTFGNHAFLMNSPNFGSVHFHPIEKIIELHDQKIALYERMIKEKDEMVAVMKGLLSGR